MGAVGEFERSNYVSYSRNLAISSSFLTRFFLFFLSLHLSISLSPPLWAASSLRTQALSYLPSTSAPSNAQGPPHPVDSSDTEEGKNAFVFLCGWVLILVR